MKQILIIDDSPLFRDYLKRIMHGRGFEIVEATNGLEGKIKMRQLLPDLVILDYNISRISSIEILKDRLSNPNTKVIPLIMLSAKIDRKRLLDLANFGISKFFSKPIKVDELLTAISQLLRAEIKVDDTPCIIETHFNEDVLFIEISQGLNTEKIQLLKYRITELVQIYKVSLPKVLVMISNVDLGPTDVAKTKLLFDTIFSHPSIKPGYSKVLTKSKLISDYLATHESLNIVGVAEDLRKAMDELLGLKPDLFAHDDVVQDKVLTATKPKVEQTESFQMGFEFESAKTDRQLEKQAVIAVIDDDFVVRELSSTVFEAQGWITKGYENGRMFVEDLPNHDFDLIFLDLMMPEMNGVEVLQYLKERQVDTPIIVFSALTNQETVMRVLRLGVKSYIVKPITPDKILAKAKAVLERTI